MCSKQFVAPCFVVVVEGDSHGDQFCTRFFFTNFFGTRVDWFAHKFTFWAPVSFFRTFVGSLSLLGDGNLSHFLSSHHHCFLKWVVSWNLCDEQLWISMQSETEGSSSNSMVILIRKCRFFDGMKRTKQEIEIMELIYSNYPIVVRFINHWQKNAPQAVYNGLWKYFDRSDLQDLYEKDNSDLHAHGRSLAQSY